MLISLSEAQMGALLPAYVHVDRHFNISAIGPSIARYMPQVAIGMPCADAFGVVNFDTQEFLRDGQGIQPVKLTSRVGNIALSGAAVFQDGACLLAVRFALSDETFNDSSLDFSDFGHSDSVVLSTMLIALQGAMLEESHATALELAHERQRSADLLTRSSRVAGYMAHDFNNLLSIIQLNADRLTRKFGHDADILKLADIIHETASRGSGITKSLMTLSQQRTDTLQLFGIDEVINENAQILHSLVGSTVTLTLDLRAGTLKSIVSYNGLLNGLINLLINAREAMPNGGHINLSTSVGVGVVTRGGISPATEIGDYIAIQVADNGEGMSDALLSRAFEPLFSSKPSGTGLGLASVRNFAVEAGGDVWLESTPGSGTTVFLHLPVAAQSVTPAFADQVVGAYCPSNPNDKQRILLVEDEPYALEALCEMLEAEGYAVTPCNSSAQAMIALEEDKFEILLTDVVMPGKNGTDIARQASCVQPDIKVILMSGYVPDSAALQPGWMFLRKPMNSTELLHIISS